MIIAVDGPTASGKGTIAKALAAHFGLPHLDTGLLYRAVGRQVVLSGGDPDSAGDALAACQFPDSLLDDPELRSETTGGLASRVSVHPAVRQALFDRQRGFATQGGGAVLDGRDIGTVIAPEAEAKLFVVASVPARAKRRFLEMHASGRAVDPAAIEADLAARDARDTSRAAAPLAAADDAMVLDTSDLGREEAIAAAIALVNFRMASTRVYAAVARLDDLPPGTKKLVMLGATPVLLCRDGEQVHAVSNQCSHAQEPLECGRMRGGWIACPVHGARFDLETGEALSLPATEPIKTYPVRIAGGMIEVAV